MSKYDDLVSKLKEIFQIDKPELDFGVYRILNARATEINDYLEKRLKAKVIESLSSAGNAESEQVKKDLAEAEKNATSLGVAPENVPKVLELRQKLASYSSGNNEHENAVFTHLLTFFSRYYDSGDFISQRRYKGDTYAIPYAGEEVMLHWANKDQYYTKSGENFSNYAFKLDDGRLVRFKLVTADTAKDNRKDNDKERRFALIEAQTRTLIDDEGDKYDETLQPITEETNLEGTQELVIRFEYKAYPKGTKQETLSEQAIKTVLAHEIVKARWLDLTKREPTEKNPTRTLLEKCLTNYTSKNTADYFIHKDLGGFLKRELDFYIKNEVMHLDDVQHAQAFADIEKNLRMIQTLRSIAQDIITFLAQLEDFQKKLWLKKKFVVSTNYCITLDRIDEAFYPQIAANQKQWEQWQQLGMLDGKIPSGDAAIAHLTAYPYLMVDTALFDAEFKYGLLKKLDRVDDDTEGLLFNGDNFHSLALIQKKYYKTINCIYIDPPYNAQSSEILYKNSFKHSSWLSFISSRVECSLPLLNSDYVYMTAIDEVENVNLGQYFKSLFSNEEISNISVVHNPTGQQGNNLSFTHEFLYLVYPYGKSILGLEDRSDTTRDAEPDVRPLRNVSSGKNHFRESAANCFYPIYVKNAEIIGFGEVCNDNFHPGSINIERSDGTVEVYPIDPQGAESKWVFARNTVESIFDELKAEFNPKKKVWDIIRTKSKFRYKTVWTDKRYSANSWGSVVLNNLIPNSGFTYPKSIFTVMDCIDIGLSNRNVGWVIDYFAGSGTSGHAVINLNREDQGKRKYILIEQGEYFDTVTKPRIQKVVYSADWKDGKATAPETGISHAFKVLKIESYEDTLNNLQLNRSQAQQDLLSQLPETAQEDYLMRYMLDVESKDSLLSVKHFNKPFDYKLKVAVDSAGAYEEKPVDLVETFNYLIGLHVAQIDYQLNRGYAEIKGTLPSGERTLVFWRDCETIGYEELNSMLDKLAINPADSEYDVVFINGDHNIPTSFTALENEGGITKTLKIRSIEEAFLTAMFDVEDV